jgi:pyroglutamyl-peptidase
MPAPRPVILLTGFGAFPGIPDNLSARFVPQLAERAARRYRAHHVVSDVLATEWTAAPRRLAELYARHAPKLALHFGVSSAATGFVIETIAINGCAPSPDAAGCLPPASLIEPHGAASVPTGLPAEAIVRDLSSHGIPATVSADAGQYLCNTVFYRALQHAAAAPGRTPITGFIHLPASFARSGTAPSGPPAFTLPVALAGAMRIIRVCLASVPPAPG